MHFFVLHINKDWILAGQQITASAYCLRRQLELRLNVNGEAGEQSRWWTYCHPWATNPSLTDKCPTSQCQLVSAIWNLDHSKYICTGMKHVIWSDRPTAPKKTLKCTYRHLGYKNFVVGREGEVGKKGSGGKEGISPHFLTYSAIYTDKPRRSKTAPSISNFWQP